MRVLLVSLQPTALSSDFIMWSFIFLSILLSCTQSYEKGSELVRRLTYWLFKRTDRTSELNLWLFSSGKGFSDFRAVVVHGTTFIFHSNYCKVKQLVMLGLKLGCWCQNKGIHHHVHLVILSLYWPTVWVSVLTEWIPKEQMWTMNPASNTGKHSDTKLY